MIHNEPRLSDEWDNMKQSNVSESQSRGENIFTKIMYFLIE